MRWLKRISVTIVAALIFIFAVAWLRGTFLPVHHATTVAGDLNASPEKVFLLISTVPTQPTWRTGLVSIEPLQPESGKEHWREHLAHNQTMDFIADETVPSTRRVVRLDLPNASYTGSWIYQLTPGATPNTTHVTITEDGNIYPAVYRTLMHDVIGMQSNLNQYLGDLKRATATP